MLLKVFNEVRTKESSFRQFVETDQLDTDRRMALLRRFQLTDEEIEVALAEDVEGALAIIERQLGDSFAEAGLMGDDASGTVKTMAEATYAVVEREIIKWNKQYEDLAWPGGKRPCAESIEPSIALPNTPVQYVIDGWFLDNRSFDQKQVLEVNFCPAGLAYPNDTMIPVDAVSIVELGHHHYRVTLTKSLPEGVYDLVLTHRTSLQKHVPDDDPEILNGRSRIPGAVTVKTRAVDR